MFRREAKRLSRRDNAVSPVIGTILMVAVTVVLAATVYVAVNGFGNKAVKEPSNAAFKVQALDTTNNGRTDRIKITYLTGPSGVPLADVVSTVTDGTTAVSPVAALTGTWDPGDFEIYDPAAAGAFFVSVSVYGTTVIDQSVTIDE